MRRVMVIALLMMLTGCTANLTTEKRNGYFVNHAFESAAQNERIRFLIMHYTALNDSQSLKRLTGDQVSAHYLIPEIPASKQGQPVVLQLVNENKRAWHAGVSSWHGRSNINDTSIGIEIVNPGYTEDMFKRRTWYPYNEKQFIAIAMLAKDIIHRYQITPDNVLGHSDIAPLRKQDPGKLFPWQRLAAMGIGAWPDKSSVTQCLAGRSPHEPANVSVIQALLKRYGYDKIPQNGILDKDTRETLSAFQMHFRPNDISGNADAETEAIACALVEKYRAPAIVNLQKEMKG
ncbi:TPA: N-acetylmuramoyl-L-alanine amidase [Salmonella enterica]|nr:N-acetylmuramoyl-L-alanine amidase [Salmonella enterica]